MNCRRNQTKFNKQTQIQKIIMKNTIFNMNEAANIPGMIEPVEQQSLFDTCSQIELKKNECVIEFGPFLGRSTNCISQGLTANKSFSTENNSFIAYDSFECDSDGDFAKHVLAHCKSGDSLHLLRKYENKIDFKAATEYHLRPYIENRTVTIEKSELTDAFPPSQAIAFMHIDSPKFYNEFKTILYRFIPQVNTGGIIVFQDFFYHWSASLIAICALLIESSHLKPTKSSASSLYCTVEKKIDLKTIAEVDLIMSSESNIPILIDAAIQQVKSISLDRSHLFLPRLTLAKFQWLYERNFHAEASREIRNYLKSNKNINASIFNDFLELLSHGCSVRESYKNDH